MPSTPIIKEPSSSSEDEVSYEHDEDLNYPGGATTSVQKSSSRMENGGTIVSTKAGKKALTLDTKSLTGIEHMQNSYVRAGTDLIEAGRVEKAAMIHMADPVAVQGPSAMQLLLQSFNELSGNDKRFTLGIIAVMLFAIILYLILGSSSSIKTVGIIAGFGIFAKMAIQWMSHHEKEIIKESMNQRNEIVASVEKNYDDGLKEMKLCVVNGAKEMYTTVVDAETAHKKIEADVHKTNVNATRDIHRSTLDAKLRTKELSENSKIERQDNKNKAILQKSKLEKDAEVKKVEMQAALERDKLIYEAEQKKLERELTKALTDMKFAHNKELERQEKDYLAKMQREDRELEKLKTEAEKEQKRFEMDEETKRHAKELEDKKARHRAELDAKLQEEKAKMDFEKQQYNDTKTYENKGIFAKGWGFLAGN